MAFNPYAAYGSQVDTFTDPAGYPWGKARNDAVPGDGLGTPLEKGWISDLFGFEQALLAAAGITPSGTPDKVGASQYLAAILQLTQTISDARSAISDARSALGLLKSQAKNWPERVSFASTAMVNSDVGLAWAPAIGASSSPLFILRDVTKFVYTSPDGRSWTARGSLTNLGSAAVHCAYGQLDGAPAFVGG